MPIDLSISTIESIFFRVTKTITLGNRGEISKQDISYGNKLSPQHKSISKKNTRPAEIFLDLGDGVVIERCD